MTTDWNVDWNDDAVCDMWCRGLMENLAPLIERSE